MKKIILVVSILLVSGCTAHTYPERTIQAVSNEKNTNIYVNDEYQGSEMANLRIMNKESKHSYVYGKKSGCQTSKLKIMYKFDIGVLWLLDLNNIPRLLTWNVWKVDEDKSLYNVTPVCY